MMTSATAAPAWLSGRRTAVAFTYRSIDRLILNAYIPTLQTPGAVAYFLRDVCHKPHWLAGSEFSG